MMQQKPYNFTAVPQITEWLTNIKQLEDEPLYDLSLKAEPRVAPSPGP